MKKLCEILVVTVFLVVSTIFYVSVEASDTHYSEDFTTTTHRDAVNTTACWDTVVGELRLFPFVPTLSGALDTPGIARGVYVSGDYAFVGDLDYGLQVIDISNPASPTLLGTCNTPGTVRGVYVSGDYAFVADYGPGLQVIDVSNPAIPTIVGTCNTPGNAYDVYVSGDYAFVVDYGGLRVIDISDPTSPAIVGNCGTPCYAYGICVSGNYAFVADNECGLHVIDISDPTSPALVGTCDTPGNALGVYVSGDHAFVAAKEFLHVIDISDPTSPVLVGTSDAPGFAHGVCVSGDYAFVAEWDWDSGLTMIDISDPTSPVLVGTCEAPGRATDVYISGNHAFLADGASGLQIIKICEPVLPPVPAGIVGLPSYGGRIATAGDHVYVGGDMAGLQVVDISDPHNPIIVGSVDTPRRAIHIDVDGNYAYVTDYWPIGSNTFYVIDISDPTNPMIAGSFGTPDHIQGLDVEGDYAYVCNGTYGFKVLDISDPTNPTLAGNLATSDWFHTVTVLGDYAFIGLGDGGGFLTVDISDPTNPTPAGYIATSDNTYHIVVCGDYAFVCCMEAGFFVMDISDPTNPVIVGSYDTPGYAQFAAVEGDYAYVADRDQGVLMFDVSDPTNPVLLGSYMTPNVANCVDIAGDHAFVTTGYVGYLVVLDAFQRSLDTENNTARSLAVNALTKDIAKVQLATTEVGNITWSVSADNGLHWEPIVPGEGWLTVTHTGNELMWKSQHFYDLTQPDVNPTCSALEMEWIYSHIEVGFDIKPGSCPNPFNAKYDPDENGKGKGPDKKYEIPKKGGVLPAAIVGTEDLDVNDIDVSTILLEGMAPIRSNYEDVTRPVEDGSACACTDLGPDGYLDLTLKFSRVALAEFLGSVENGEVVELTITGSLLDGTQFEGSDCVTIVGKRSSGPKFEKIDVVELEPPVPNPFNPMTRISYSVPNMCAVSLEIFDSSGKLIIRLLDNVTVTGGMHTVEWRGVDKYGRAVSSGVYYYRLRAGSEIISRKMVLLR